MSLRIRRKHNAFTLIELLVVMTVIAVLAVVVMPKFVNRTGQAKNAAAQSDLKLIRNAIQMFQSDTGVYPQYLSDLTVSTAPSYVTSGFNGPYVQGTLPNDPTQTAAAAASPTNYNWNYTASSGGVTSSTNSSW